MAKQDTLQIDQNLEFQRREWRVQRLGWWALAAFIAAAILGVFGGGGPLGRARAATPDTALSVEYERFLRVGAATRLTIHVARGGPADLRISRAWFDRMRLQRITPEPAAIDIGVTETVLSFANAAPFTLVIDAEPLQSGRYRATLAVGGGPPLTFRQFVYF